MAYDKVVDSAALDTAMTYTANRIRNKTGGTDQIAWDSAKGFGDAVDAITGGGADHSVEDAIITRSIAGAYSNERITTVGKNAFFACLQLKSVDFPNVTSISDNTFTSCNRLTTVSAPKLTTIGQESFSYTTILTEHTFLLVTTMGRGAFSGTGAPALIFPVLTTIPADAFRNSETARLDLGAATSIARTSFTDAKKLETLIIRTASVCTISEASVALRGTKIAAGTGYIYVPDDLVDSYKAATNWVAFANQIKPVSALEAST